MVNEKTSVPCKKAGYAVFLKILRSIVLIVAIIFLFFFITPMTVGIVHTGTVVGTIACVCLITFSVFTDKVILAVKYMYKNIFLRIILLAVSAFVALGILFVITLSVCMLGSSMNNATGTENAVIVLGCKVRGTEPSLMLQRRIEKAYEFCKDNPEIMIIASGGQGADEEISEAECIKKSLVSMGISPDRIITEDKSTDTYENFENSLKELDGESPTVAVVTDGFHQFRAGLICKKFGAEKTSLSAKTPWYLLPCYVVREWFGLAEQIFLK